MRARFAQSSRRIGMAAAAAAGGLRHRGALRPRLQKATSKLIYGFASRAGADPGMTFLNYGYAPLEPDAARDAAAIEDADRFGTNLYDRVASGAPLAGCDVLEVGCGRGGGAAFVFERHRPRSLVGLDLARSAVERARREQGRAGLEFVQGDAEALPFADASFDAVLNVESAHWYPDVPQFLREVHRVLRPGGCLLLADFRRSDLTGSDERNAMPNSDIHEFIAQLEASPLTIVEQEDITENVRHALELDSPRRRRMIEARHPRLLQRGVLAFSAVVGTPLYEALASGEMTYRRFVLRKT